VSWWSCLETLLIGIKHALFPNETK
jgi:hypothetical protein